MTHHLNRGPIEAAAILKLFQKDISRILINENKSLNTAKKPFACKLNIACFRINMNNFIRKNTLT